MGPDLQLATATVEKGSAALSRAHSSRNKEGPGNPDWYVDEAGITAIALLMIGVGLWSLRRESYTSDEL